MKPATEVAERELGIMDHPSPLNPLAGKPWAAGNLMILGSRFWKQAGSESGMRVTGTGKLSRAC